MFRVFGPAVGGLIITYHGEIMQKAEIQTDLIDVTTLSKLNITTRF